MNRWLLAWIFATKQGIVHNTAMEEYVFQAFDVDALHYIVKPFSDDKFLDVLERAVKKAEGRKLAEADKEEYIMVQMSGIHAKISLGKIVYAEVFNRKVMVHMVDGTVEYYGRISDLEKKVGEEKSVQCWNLFLSVTFFSLCELSSALAGKIDSLFFEPLIMSEKIAAMEWLWYGVYVSVRILNIFLCTLYKVIFFSPEQCIHADHPKQLSWEIIH